MADCRPTKQLPPAWVDEIMEKAFNPKGVWADYNVQAKNRDNFIIKLNNGANVFCKADVPDRPDATLYTDLTSPRTEPE